MVYKFDCYHNYFVFYYLVNYYPINKIIKLIFSMGNKSSLEIDDSYLKDITFKDDKDIDELFQICKNLVKGGFTEDQNKYEKIKYLIKCSE